MSAWTKEELELVRLWTNQGWTAKSIGEELNRSEKSIVHKRGTLRLVTRKQYSDQELLDILAAAPSTNAEYFMNEPSLPSVNTYQRHFGSWNSALIAAGLPTNTSSLQEGKPTTLYVVKFPEFYKVGITQSTIEKRFSGKQYPEFTVVYKCKYSLDEAKALEKKLLLDLQEYSYRPDNFGGCTECFKMSNYEFDLFIKKLYN